MNEEDFCLLGDSIFGFWLSGLEDECGLLYGMFEIEISQHSVDLLFLFYIE